MKTPHLRLVLCNDGFYDRESNYYYCFSNLYKHIDLTAKLTGKEFNALNHIICQLGNIGVNGDYYYDKNSNSYIHEFYLGSDSASYLIRKKVPNLLKKP